MVEIYLTSVASNVMENIAKQINKSTYNSEVLFITTASNTEKNKSHVDADMFSLLKCGFKVKAIDISKEKKEKSIQLIRQTKVLFICGGNTFYLLQEIKRKKLLSIIKNSIYNGTIYIGSSAGSAILSPTIAYVNGIDDKSKAPHLKYSTALNMINALIMPHKNNTLIKTKIPQIQKRFTKYKLICLDDNEYIRIKNNKIVKVKV